MHLNLFWSGSTVMMGCYWLCLYSKVSGSSLPDWLSSRFGSLARKTRVCCLVDVQYLSPETRNNEITAGRNMKPEILTESSVMWRSEWVYSWHSVRRLYVPAWTCTTNSISFLSRYPTAMFSLSHKVPPSYVSLQNNRRYQRLLFAEPCKRWE